MLYNIGQVLGITLLHSLWQGLLIYAVIRLLLIAFPAASAGKKYSMLYTGLLAMAVWFAYTFFMEANTYNWSAATNQHFAVPNNIAAYNTTVAPATQPIEQPFYYQYKQLLKTYLPYISVLYLLSVLINLARLAMGWQKIRRIKQQATAANTWQPLTDKLAARAGIIKHVQISFSSLVDVPCAFGYIKPILLLPLSISTQLSAEEIEVIILHELVHIKNNDYILNLIQQIIALLLFLNPFAQLISRMIDLERENRCDDTVLQIGDPLTYAGALVKLEKTRQQNLQLALAATGKKYHLFARIKRIMSEEKPVVNIKHLVFGMLIFIGSVGSIAWLNPEIKNGRLTSKNGAVAVQQLAKIVKEVIAPDNSEEINSKAIPGEAAVKTSIDSAANVAVVDSSAIKKAERNALIDEYEKVFNDWVDGNERMKKMPEAKDANEARRILDSVRWAKFNATLTPELEQEIRDMENSSTKYRANPEVLRKQAIQQQFVRQFLDAINKQPEIIAYEQEHKRLKDSVQKAIMLANNLTEDQLSKNGEWHNWLRKESSRRSSIERKVEILPEIRALQDSLDKISRLITTSPEYQEYRKRKWSKAYLDATRPPGLEKYEAAVKEAREKLGKTSAAIKNQQDQKRLDEIQRRLNQLKQIKP